MSMIETAKEVVQLVQKLDNVELLSKVIALQGEAAELSEQLHRLRKENGELRERLNLKDEVQFRHNAYWRMGEGPFCSRCFDRHALLVRMHFDENLSNENSSSTSATSTST